MSPCSSSVLLRERSEGHGLGGLQPQSHTSVPAPQCSYRPSPSPSTAGAAAGSRPQSGTRSPACPPRRGKSHSAGRAAAEKMLGGQLLTLLVTDQINSRGQRILHPLLTQGSPLELLSSAHTMAAPTRAPQHRHPFTTTQLARGHLSDRPFPARLRGQQKASPSPSPPPGLVQPLKGASKGHMTRQGMVMTCLPSPSGKGIIRDREGGGD